MECYDVEDIINDLVNEPKTIKSIVGEMYGNNSYTIRLKNCLNKACERNEIFKGRLLGRHRQRIYFSPEKEYLIVNVQKEDSSTDVFCVFKMQEEKTHWNFIKAKILLNNEWKDINNRRVLKKDILNFY